MAAALNPSEELNNGQSNDGEVDLNQAQSMFTEWLDSDVQDGIYR